MGLKTHLEISLYKMHRPSLKRHLEEEQSTDKGKNQGATSQKD